MGFVGVFRAIYDYAPQGDQELAISEGDLLYILEKSTSDDWWKAKKKAPGEDDDEPVGLIPNNYVEEAQPTHLAKALYDYTRQTDEELSFAEDAALTVYDTSDPDWSLVGSDGDYGFAPSNYIELTEEAPPAPPPKPSRDHDEDIQPPTPSSTSSAMRSPAAALAGIMGGKASAPPSAAHRAEPAASKRPTYTPDASDDESPTPPPPSLPSRPRAGSDTPSSPGASPRGVRASPPHHRTSLSQHTVDVDEDSMRSPGGFHMYHVSEMATAMGKRKKLPTTLGINIANGTIMVAPEKSRDGPQQEWTAEKLTHYSIEGKHIFLEFIRPSKSYDLHGGARDTAQEIVAALGEIAGAARAEGLREVIAAGSGTGKTQKKGQILYDFMAQGDDEVTVAVGDDVIIVDDTKSDEWWMVRRLKNGKEGVVPSSYVEMTGMISIESPSSAGINAGLSMKEQNRLEEERLAREASARSRRDDESSEVGLQVRPPERGSSLMAKSIDSRRTSTRGKRDSRGGDGRSAKSKPESSRMRTWTDRSNLFKVEAEYIGCTDGKIHLHKSNGVKIAVPVVKMSREDLEYVERISGMSLDEDKPLSDIRRRSQITGGPRSPMKPEPPRKDDFDWFDFFLKCGVGVHQCERYASNFARDSMDETVLPDINPSVLRTLGLKEGDILRVMKYLDNRFGRSGDARGKRNVSFGGAEVIGDMADLDGEGANGSAGGLFSGPGGTLKNNTRKGRPAPAVQTNDTVDPKAFEVSGIENANRRARSEASTPTAAAAPSRKTGFDDDAWDVKPSKTAAVSSPPPAAAQPAKPQQPALTGAMQDLSLLTPALQPTIAHPTPPPQTSQPQPPPSSQQQQPPQQQTQATGASPAFFQQLGQQQQPQNPGQAQPTGFNPQQTGFNQQQQVNGPPRQRPAAPPQQQQASGSLMLPPPSRPLSAPQNVSQQSMFGPPPPLQAQLTGVQFTGGVQTRVAPPGQSLNEINQSRFQPQFGQPQGQPQFSSQQQFPGVAPQPTGMGQFANGMIPQPTGFQAQQQMLNGQQAGSPFANPIPQQPTGFGQPVSMQPTGAGSFFPQPSFQQPQPTGVNASLPPALQPQPTGQQNQAPQGFGQPPPPVPPIPQQPTVAPLQPQQTGPAPPVRFGVTGEAKKLTPQPTGRRANLSQATPQNPFGF